MSMRIAANGRPLPQPTPVAAPFFDGLRAGRVRLPHCPRDGWFFYPRSHCPTCLRRDWDWREASGRGRVHAYTVDRMGHEPGLKAQVPFVIALVDLDEGPRMVANIVGCDLAALRVGMPVEAVVELVEDVPLLHFRPY